MSWQCIVKLPLQWISCYKLYLW